uniref:ATP-binding protein n=1 Tax=Trichloromonas sp. TaxID=3069249 RepID=UPI003D81C42B
IHRLCDVAKEIAAGNFKVIVPPMSTPDFSELGTALQEMAASLKERDQQIGENYRELEETNRELQLSYERQEQIGTELGRSREMYRSLLEDASDAILVSDEEDRLVLLNKAAESFFGVSRNTVHGNNVFTFWEKLKIENVEMQYEMHQSILHGMFHEAEVRFIRPTDQSKLIGWAKGSPVVGKDGKRMVQMTFRDVTHEREIKENLEQSTLELQRLNQMKDSFLGLASHELKTPLTVILGYTDLLLDEMGDQFSDEALPMLKHIGDAANRLSNIVRDMVDVSRLDNKCLRLRSRKTHINDVILQALKEIEFFFSVRHQSHQLNLAGDLPDLLCDPDRMVQVVTNLVINSIKFTPDGGNITIATRLLQSCRVPQVVNEEDASRYREIGSELYPYVEIQIIDTGIGIDESDQIHIFDKFYEVGIIEEHFTGKVAFKGKGTGLGLTIVKGIVDMHGGEIWVESPGCDPHKYPGSTFHILLPVNPPA